MGEMRLDDSFPFESDWDEISWAVMSTQPLWMRIERCLVKREELIMWQVAGVTVGPIVCSTVVGMGSSEHVVEQLHVKN